MHAIHRMRFDHKPSDLYEISDPILLFSYWASQNKGIKFGNRFFEVCCAN